MHRPSTQLGGRPEDSDARALPHTVAVRQKLTLMLNGTRDLSPFAIGCGTSLFGGLERLQVLRLASSTAFPSGVIELVYERTAR